MSLIARATTHASHLLLTLAIFLSISHIQPSAQAQLLDPFGAVAGALDIQGTEYTTYDPETGIASAKGNVNISYEGVEIRAGEAQFNTSSGDIMASNGVTVVKEGITYRGDEIIYNVNTGKLTAAHLRSGLGAILYDTEEFLSESKDNEALEASKVYFTTHDSERPNYHLKAKRITIYPNDRVVFRNVTFYAGRTPVLWFPVFAQPFDDELGYTFSPGYNSNWGLFLLNQYGMLHGDHTLAKYKLDLRSDRGVGLGVDFISQKHRDMEHEDLGLLRLYYTYDTDPSLNSANQIRRQDLDESRYRINFHQRVYLPGPEESTLYLDFDINKISDEFFYEDFFFSDARLDPRPDNNIKLVKTHPRGTLTLWTRFQLNDFLKRDTRLPELALDLTRQPLGNTGLFYQSETSLGIYEESLSDIEIRRAQGQITGLEAQIAAQDAALALLESADGDMPPALNSDPLAAVPTLDPNFDRDAVELQLAALQSSLDEPGFTRIHTYHELTYPQTFGDWLTVVPRAGIGGTYYGDVSGGTANIGNEFRPMLHAGFDLSTKISKVYPNIIMPRLGIEEIRHIVQPYLNYSYLYVDETAGLPSIDRLTPTTRPRPIDVPLFTAIDDLTEWNVARIGVRNLFQTKRNGRTYNYLGLNTYVDAFVDDPESNRSLSNLYNDFFWRPLPWLALTIDSQLPLGNDPLNFTEVNSRLNWMPHRRLELSLGHQYISDNPFFADSSLLTFRGYYRLTENWGLSMNQRFELEDSTLEYQSYAIHRDLSSWTASFGALIRDNRGDEEFGLLLSFTLKDFPQVSIPLDIDPSATGGENQ